MQRDSNGLERRLQALRWLIVVVLGVLCARLWQLQMVEGRSYRLLADRNRLREVDVAAPRGVIYDRAGKILARNRPSFTVALVPADLPKDKEGEPEGSAAAIVLDRLMALLEQPLPNAAVTPTPDQNATRQPTQTVAVSGAAIISAPPAPVAGRPTWIRPRAEIETSIEEGGLGGAYQPIAVATYVQEGTAFLIAENAINLPGVELIPEPIRDFPSGTYTSQIVGYMGSIPEGSLADYKDKGYSSTEQVGLAGIEDTFEAELRGKPGQQTIEVDVNGRKVRTVGDPEPAVPGHNLVLTLDLDLQKAATQALQEELDKSKGFTKATQGAVVALDPRSGALLALVALPSYDNNLFAEGITPEAWQALIDDPDHPLFNQAIQGRYPPGSTFKMIVAAGGLQDGVISARTLLGDGFDGKNDGVIWLPNQYFPWDQTKAQRFVSWSAKQGFGYGFITIRDAIAVSDDIFFYQLGGGYLDVFHGLGAEAIGFYARAFGLGNTSGIDLPGEARGLVPDAKWKRLNYAENWLTGDTYNMSIGQGFVLATPLQMANATAVVANRGYLYRPQLVDHITDAAGKTVRTVTPETISEVAVDPAHLDTVREGMYGAVNWAQGTALGARLPGIAVAGKTGTAEYFRDMDKDNKPDRDEKGNLPTHAWFTAFAPYVDPEIVVTVFIANGGEGSVTAVPVAAKVLKTYFGLDKPEATPSPAETESPKN